MMATTTGWPWGKIIAVLIVFVLLVSCGRLCRL